MFFIPDKENFQNMFGLIVFIENNSAISQCTGCMCSCKCACRSAEILLKW